MTATLIPVGTGRRAGVDELGSGPPLLYLHDIIDIHGSSREWFPFHRALSERATIVALAHAGCADSDEDDDAETADDVVFHVLESLDALGLARLPVVGVGVGGWIAAELAVRHPDLVERLVLVGATGLFVPSEPISDVFMAAHPIDGVDLRELRALLFTDPDSALANEHVPDGRMAIDREMLRYRMYRFANRLGFRPPYLYNRQLIRRLPRYRQPSLVVWGERDSFVPLAHARSYSSELPEARLHVFPNAGHSIHIEHGEEMAALIGDFLAR